MWRGLDVYVLIYCIATDNKASCAYMCLYGYLQPWQFYIDRVPQLAVTMYRSQLENGSSAVAVKWSIVLWPTTPSTTL